MWCVVLRFALIAITTPTEHDRRPGRPDALRPSVCGMPVAFDLSTLDNAIRTIDVSLISHTHGRVRRKERNIQRIELQAAIKHGTKERANPGRDGSLRWRYTHDGVVYITDDTSRHEVTSWRIDGKDAPRKAVRGGLGSLVRVLTLSLLSTAAGR